MKAAARKAVEAYLAFMVRIKLLRTRPTIIGVTGSFGKTSTKEAIYHVLKKKHRVYRNAKSLNTEIGLLLAILEQPSGFSSPLKWFFILVRAVFNAFFGRGYDFLVLEYGADKPGDIEHLVSRVTPHVAIITHVGRVHQAKDQFADVIHVFNEKKKLVESVGESGTVLLNKADPLLKKLTHLKAKTVWWDGHCKDDEAEISADRIVETKSGFSARLHYKKREVVAHIPVAGGYHIDVVLPALLCGTLFDVSIEQGLEALQHFSLPPGRMSVIEGHHGAVLLDSTYNASPQAVIQALHLLKAFPGKRKIAVLGNMNELGEYSDPAHLEIAEPIGPWLDILITVGEQAKKTALYALKKGLGVSTIKALSTPEEAADFLVSDGVTSGDVILFKGSQNKVRLERAVKLLMKHPEDAHKLLCRQEKEWQKID